MDNQLIICHCSRATKGQILEAIQKGAKSLDDIQEMTSACTVGNCKALSPTQKCCSPRILALLNEHAK